MVHYVKIIINKDVSCPMFGSLLSCTAWTSVALDLCVFAPSKPFREDVNICSGASFATNGIQTCRQHPDRALHFVLASGCLLFTYPLLWQHAGLRLLPTSSCLEVHSGLLGHQLWSFELKLWPLAHPVGSHASEEQMAKSKLTNGPPSRPTLEMKGHILAWNCFSDNA